MEGDAVIAETQMSSFGRGLQPSFSMEYRAMLLEGDRPKVLDTWFSGSFRRHMPDHYRLGYQIMSWSWGRYGENILDKTSRFTSRNPWMLFPFAIALKKFYGTSTGLMLTEAFDDLEKHWRSLPLEDNSAEIIETPITSYTTYTSPRAVNGGIVALKEDLDKTPRLVLIEERMQAQSGHNAISERRAKGLSPKKSNSAPPLGAHYTERALCRTGIVNSPLAVLGNRIYWTETRRSTFWDQKTGSVLCSYNMATGHKRTHGKHRNVLYPTAAGDSLAWVEYHPEGFYSIGNRKLPDTIFVHGLAYDSGKLYFIALGDSGMWIGASGDSIEQVTKPSRVTISSLTAGDGVLYFNSIASGKDEIHKLDLATGKEYRITTSRYGSFSGAPIFDMAGSSTGIVATTYTPDGYMLSKQEIPANASLDKVSYSNLPRNILNPVHVDWEVPNLDDITVAETTVRSVKKYRRGFNLFNFHSWAPAYFEPDELMGEAQFNPRIGLTAMSQNNLNSAYTELGYGYTGRHSVAHAKFKYLGWAPKIEFDLRWADTPQLIYGRPINPREIQDHLEFKTHAYLPFTLSSGAMTHILTPMVQWSYINERLYEDDSINYETGTNQFTAGIQYSANRLMAYRDFAPRFGYSVRVHHTRDLLNDDFGRLWRAMGHVRLPGIGSHHSLLLSGAWQQQKTKMYIFRAKELFPRGADYDAVYPEHYRAASVNYALPLAYPDGGINSLLYVRRIRLSAGFDYAYYKNFRTPYEISPRWQSVWSYGADLTFDISPLRLPQNTSSTITLSIYKPSDKNRLWGGFTLSLPI